MIIHGARAKGNGIVHTPINNSEVTLKMCPKIFECTLDCQFKVPTMTDFHLVHCKKACGNTPRIREINPEYYQYLRDDYDIVELMEIDDEEETD